MPKSPRSHRPAGHWQTKAARLTAVRGRHTFGTAGRAAGLGRYIIIHTLGLISHRRGPLQLRTLARSLPCQSDASCARWNTRVSHRVSGFFLLTGKRALGPGPNGPTRVGGLHGLWTIDQSRRGDDTGQSDRGAS